MARKKRMARARVTPLPRKQLVLQLRHQKVHEVAASYGVSTRTITRWKHKYGLSVSRSGQRHWNSKLSTQEITEIKNLRHAGYLLMDIAVSYDISRGHCGTICKGVAKS